MKKNGFQLVLRRGIAFAFLALMLCGVLVSCSDGGSEGGETSYCVTVSGTDLKPDMEMKSVTAALGNANNVRESQACPPFTGTERLYDFAALQVTTYEESGTERVMVIFLKDESTSVSGVKIGSSVAEMKTALGEAYTMLGTGTYVYTADNGSVLKCGVKDDVVRSISITTEKADD
ncbi:MAG: hypothetical protein IKC26_06445 [Clostridia bacterium]|nr:hypothetical protein [Clostridia bacterium]